MPSTSSNRSYSRQHDGPRRPPLLVRVNYKGSVSPTAVSASGGAYRQSSLAAGHKPTTCESTRRNPNLYQSQKLCRSQSRSRSQSPGRGRSQSLNLNRSQSQSQSLRCAVLGHHVTQGSHHHVQGRGTAHLRETIYRERSLSVRCASMDQTAVMHSTQTAGLSTAARTATQSSQIASQGQGMIDTITATVQTVCHPAPQHLPWHKARWRTALVRLYLQRLAL
jgi:hypothetical protein